MKRSLAFLLILPAFTLTGTAAGSGPDIRIVDNKVSIQADGIPLSRLLRLLDQVTGMTSKVPPELANRNVSVRFKDLNFDDAVHKIFEGQPVDYVVLEGRGIIVTGTSQAITRNSGPSSPPPPENVAEENPGALPPQQQPNGQNQPAMIQTPFGSIPNPRANQPGQPNPSPTVAPGPVAPQNPFNASLPGFSAPSQLPPLQSNPTFGSPTTPQPANSPYNNSSPFGSTTPQPANSPYNSSPFGTAPATNPNSSPGIFPGTATQQPRPNP